MKKQFTIFLVLSFILGLFPINFSNAANLSNRLKGKILLQVEAHGEAWYVHPVSGERYYMANGKDAYNIMRDLGIGITNKDLERIKSNKNLAKKHSGKIFLQVEADGEAYYIDFYGDAHYLKNGADAYKIMHDFGLGITDNDIEAIPAFQREQKRTVQNNTNEQNESIQKLTNGDRLKFDDTVIKSVLRLKIYDDVIKQDILFGSGISIGGFGDILTNYHVVEKAITDPARYQVYGCVTNSLNTQCDYFNYFLSITNPLPSNIKSVPKYDKKFDLALVYINQVYFDNKWSSILDTSLNTLKDHTVNLSSYTKNINDLYVNSPIYSIGYPDYGGGSTIQAEGVVKELFTDQRSGQKLILSSIDISHGNSGGPVFNSNGELLGVTVACLTASPNTEKCKSGSGLFIPLPTVNWWYNSITESEIITWEGKQSYLKQGNISWQSILCLLRQNAYYDANISSDSCICKIGYKKNSSGDCLSEINNNSNPLIKYSDGRYGKAPDSEAELRALKSLTDMIGSLGASSNSPRPSSEQQINDQTCVNTYGPNNVWDGNKNKISCKCKEGALYFPNEYVPSTKWMGACIDPKTITKPVTCFGHSCSYDKK